MDTPMYRIWGTDQVVYGPVELPTLITWIQAERVIDCTWVHLDHESKWVQAREIGELKMFFGRDNDNPAAANAFSPSPQESRINLKPGTLRRIKILGAMDDEQLEAFIEFMEVQEVRQFTKVVSKGDHGDAMYLILEGQLRVGVSIEGRETTLVTLDAGDFFGEISILDQGPRSADVYANEDSVLLKISVGSFERLVREKPQLAVPFLFSMGKSIATRIRNLTKQYQDSIHYSRIGGIAR